MRSLIGLTLAATLMACAAQQPDKTAMLQNTVFVVGDQAAPVQPVPTPDTADIREDKSSDSALRHLVWPLSGR